MHMPIAAVAYTMAITSLCISSLGGLVKSLIRLFSCTFPACWVTGSTLQKVGIAMWLAVYLAGMNFWNGA
jgi:hypothetical protein